MAVSTDPFTVFFTGKDDPRENLIVIGDTTYPIFYRFETPDAFTSLSARTTARTRSLFIYFLFVCLVVGARTLDMATTIETTEREGEVA